MHYTDLSTRPDIGANCHYVEIGPFRLVIDAGFHPKKVGHDTLPQLDRIPAGSLDFIILTHCHLDHVGALPILVRDQPQAQLICTQASSILAPRMLRNSHKVMCRQREELGVREYPLFNKRDIELVEQAAHPLPLGKSRTFEKDGEALELTLLHAGHIPGAASVLLRYKHRKICFTGDVLCEPLQTLDGAMLPEGTVDTLVLETTRGVSERRPDASRVEEVERLLVTINHTIERGGSVLIPAFALGRMQEILAILQEARRDRKLVECPIFCSGLGLDLVDYFEVIAKRFGGLHFRKKLLHELDVKILRKRPEPGSDPAVSGIYVLSSGMLVENTPSYAMAASMLEYPHNSLCFVGYCDPDTPGGKLLETRHDESFVFEALDYVAPMRAHVERFDLSGHADREDLIEYARSLEPRSILLTHGSDEARDWFDSQLAMDAPEIQVLNPEPGQRYLV